MKLRVCLGILMLLVGVAHAQGNPPGNRQFIPPPPGPPPPAPPPDFIDDDTDFDDGDDLPDEYPGRPAAQMGQPPAPSGSSGAPPPPPSHSGSSFADNRPHFNSDGKLHFKVVEGEYWEKGKPRQRGKLTESQ